MNDIDYLDEKVRDLERLVEKLVVRVDAFDLLKEANGWREDSKKRWPEQYRNFLRSHGQDVP
jgi:hypothetical protein